MKTIAIPSDLHSYIKQQAKKDKIPMSWLVTRWLSEKTLEA
jgi:hypothetical protein